MKKKRALMVIGTSLQNAGVPNVVMTIVRNLSTSYVFDVLVLSNDVGFYDAEFLRYGGDIFRFQSVGNQKSKFWSWHRLVQIQKKLRQILQNRSYDVVHCHCGLASGFLIRIAQKLKVQRCVVHAHGVYCQRSRNPIVWYLDWHSKILIERYATLCLACSELAGLSLFKKGNFVNVLNPVDVDYYGEIQKEPHKGIELLQIGYFCENKNQIFAVSLIEALRNERIDARLTFIGYIADGLEYRDYYDTLRASIEKRKLEEYIRFLPSDSDKRKAFAQADYSLVPSKREGLSLVALESQAANTTCLLSSNIPRDADMGKAVFLEYNDVDAWKNYIVSEVGKDRDATCPDLSYLSPDMYAKRIGELYGQ